MNKDTFLKFLSNDNRDLNKVIQEKGKRPKLINAIIFYNNKDGKNLSTKQESK